MKSSPNFDLSDLAEFISKPANYAGDAYLIEMYGSLEHPDRGEFVPLSDAEKAAWRDKYKEPAPAEVYRGPSADEIRLIPPDQRNAAEVYWLQSTDETISNYKKRIGGQYQIGVKELESAISDVDRKRAEIAKEQAEDESISKTIREAGKAAKYGAYAIAAILLWRAIGK